MKVSNFLLMVFCFIFYKKNNKKSFMVRDCTTVVVEFIFHWL